MYMYIHTSIFICMVGVNKKFPHSICSTGVCSKNNSMQTDIKQNESFLVHFLCTHNSATARGVSGGRAALGDKPGKHCLILDELGKDYT